MPSYVPTIAPTIAPTPMSVSTFLLLQWLISLTPPHCLPLVTAQRPIRLTPPPCLPLVTMKMWWAMAALMVVIIRSAAHTMPTAPLPSLLMIWSLTRIQRTLLSLDTIVLLWRRSACNRRPNMIQTLILTSLSGSFSDQRNGGKPVISSLNLSHILALFVGLLQALEKALLFVTDRVTKTMPARTVVVAFKRCEIIW